MEYDFSRNRTTSYDSKMYNRTSSSSSSPSAHPMYGQSLYPRIGQQQQPPIPSIGRHSSYHPSSPAAPSPSASSSVGLGIRVAIKPEYRISPPPQLESLGREIPRSNFQFDFDFERRILAEAEKEVPNWSKLGLENLPTSKPTPGSTSSSLGSATDPVVNKYVASGLNQEAVSIALENYGDNPTRVHEFAKAYSGLRDMGFSSNIVAEALLKNDNDTEKAIAYCLNISS